MGTIATSDKIGCGQSCNLYFSAECDSSVKFIFVENWCYFTVWCNMTALQHDSSGGEVRYFE